MWKTMGKQEFFRAVTAGLGKYAGKTDSQILKKGTVSAGLSDNLGITGVPGDPLHASILVCFHFKSPSDKRIVGEKIGTP